MKNGRDATVFVLGLVFGTASSILSKQLFEEEVDGKKFVKPLFQTMLMFLGMLIALPIHYAYQRYRAWRKERNVVRIHDAYLPLDEQGEETESGLIQDEKETFELNLKTASVLFFPAFFDLCATMLANIGLTMIEVSIYQLQKCTVIVFVAIFKRVILKTKLRGYMWAGVVLNMLAVTLASSTSFMGDSANGASEKSQTGSPALGILLVTLSCCVQAIQYVFEEKVMEGHDSEDEPEKKSMPSYPPLIVVGMEGLWGLLLSIFVLLPGAYFLPGKDNGSWEDTLDTFRMCSNSSTVSLMLLSYVFIITGYNAAGIGITFLLDAVWHSILDNFRPISVWVAQLVIWQITNGSSGEEWTNASWIQLAGLALLIFGTAVYNANIHLSCFFSYPGYSAGDRVEFENPRIAVQSSLAISPFIASRSPAFNQRQLERRRSSIERVEV